MYMYVICQKYVVTLKSNSCCLYTGTRRVLKAAPVNALHETHCLTQIPRGKLHQHKLQPRLLMPSKGFGCFWAKYVLPQSWLLALCYKWGNRCATACSAESPEVQVPLAFTESWIWSNLKMLISCTQWKWGCLGFWSCKRCTDNFTRGTSESCLNYSVLLQTPVKTGTEIRNDFLKQATNSKGITIGNEEKK